MINIKLVTEQKPVGQMPSLFVGFEIETSLRPDNEHAAEFCQAKYGITRFSHDGGSERSGASQTVNVGDTQISVTTRGGNRYDKPGIVADVYNDGSVGLEFVTRPVLTDKISVIRDEVYIPLKNELAADFVAGGKAGLHMTFTTDHHKCRSTFNRLWVRNVQQLVRMFYPDIINWRFTDTDTHTRPTHYRLIFGRNEVTTDGGSQHYSAVRLRYDEGTNNLWGVEIRIPDGTDDWAAIEAQVKFWRAMFELAWNMAKSGMLEFSQDVWEYNLSWCAARQNNYQGRQLWKKGKGRNKLVLFKFLAPFMRDPVPANHIQTWVDWYNKQTKDKDASAPMTATTTTSPRLA